MPTKSNSNREKQTCQNGRTSGLESSLTQRPQPRHFQNETTAAAATATAAEESASRSTTTTITPYWRRSPFFRRRSSSAPMLPSAAAATTGESSSTSSDSTPRSIITTSASTSAATASSPCVSSFPPLDYTLYEVENIDQAMFSLYTMASSQTDASSSLSFIPLPPVLPPTTTTTTTRANSGSFSSSYIVKQEFDPILDAQLGDEHGWNYQTPFDDIDDENVENDKAASVENVNVVGCTVNLQERSRQLLMALHQDPLQNGWETLFLDAAATFDGWLQQQNNDDNSENDKGSNKKKNNNHEERINHHHHDKHNNNNNADDWFQFGEFHDESSLSSSQNNHNSPTLTTAPTVTASTVLETATTATTATSAVVPITDDTTTTITTVNNKNDTCEEEDEDEDDFGEFQSASCCSSSSSSLQPQSSSPTLGLAQHTVHHDDASSFAKQSSPPPRALLQEGAKKDESRPKTIQPSPLFLQPTIVQLPPLPLQPLIKRGEAKQHHPEEPVFGGGGACLDEEPPPLEYWRQTLPTSIFNHYSFSTLSTEKVQTHRMSTAVAALNQEQAQNDDAPVTSLTLKSQVSKTRQEEQSPTIATNSSCSNSSSIWPCSEVTATTTAEATTTTAVMNESSCITTTSTILDDDDDTPISLTLPITDLTTLEARFTRRRQLEYEKQQLAMNDPKNQTVAARTSSSSFGQQQDDDQDLNERLDELLPNFYNSNNGKSHDWEMSQFLGSLPWGYLQEQLYDGDDNGSSSSSVNSSHENSAAATEQSAGLILWDEHMTEQLCLMDGLLECVQQTLLQRVCRQSTTTRATTKSCSSKLQQANDLIYEFETNLRLAFMYWERSNTSLQLAVRTASASSCSDDNDNTNDNVDDDNNIVDGLLGPQVLLNLWQQREEYQNLQHVLNHLHAVLEQEGEIIRRIDAFDARHASALEEYRSVMELAQRITPVGANNHNVNNTTSNDAQKVSDCGILSKLTCLDELRARRSSLGDRFRKRLHQLSQSLVVQSCRGQAVDWMQYERLVRSTLDLHSLHYQEQHCQESDDDDVSLNQYHCDDDKKDDDDVMAVHSFDDSCVRMATMWAETIMQALSYEADCCLATALLKPTDRVASNFERELGQLLQEIQLDWGDAAKLRTITHNLVTIRFDFEASKVNYFPRVFHCLCQGLTTVLHTHFLFLQWHRAPSDFEKSHTDAQLHQRRNDGHQNLATEVNCPAKNQDNSRLRYIRDGLEASRLNLWNRCENVIVLCLDEYLNFAAKRQLFQRAGGEDDDDNNSGVGEDRNAANKIDDSLWAQQLQGYHEVLDLADRFFAIKASFLEDETFVGQGKNLSAMHQKLKAIFRQHLRTVHVEAMNTLGRQLSTETWVLRSLDASRSYEPTEEAFANVEHLLRDAIRVTTENKQALLSMKSKWRPVSNTDKHGALNCFNEFLENGNPFHTCHKDSTAHSSWQNPITMDIDTQQHAISDFRTTVYSKIQWVLQEDEDKSMPRCAPASIASGLVPWVSRLLTILDKLPVLADEACCVFLNLFDLYLATVFRLCAGSSQHEKALLMAEKPPSPDVASTTHGDPGASPASANKKRPSSPTIFGSFGKERRPSGYTAAPVAIPSSLEVEMCGPRIKDLENLVPLRQFIDRAHTSLQGIVNLDRANSWIPASSNAVDADEYACEAARILEKQEAAAWSCYLVAALAEVAMSLAKASMPLPLSYSLEPLKSYVLSVMQAVPQLVKIISQYSCVKAISGLDVVKRIVTVGKEWEEHTLHEYPNDYVEDLGDRCALIWGFLSASGKLPLEIRRQAWESLLCGCYLSLLEGFSRVPYCSTEGRALMTLDLASFSAMMDTTTVSERLESRGLSFTPPPAAPEYGMRYVDTYIKVFYYPKEDAVQWIGQNYESYRLTHVLALLNDSAGKKDNGLPALVEKVKVLYHPQESAIRDRQH